MAPRPTKTSWDHEYNTLRRENLFRNPPTDRSAYPLLQAAVDPHIESFDALFSQNGLISRGIADIGTRVFLDGDDRAPSTTRNKLAIRCKGVQLQKSQLPPTNKFTVKNREILPAECRERHVSYRGKLSATFEYRINGGDAKEFTREIGQLPIMVKVTSADCVKKTPLSNLDPSLPIVILGTTAQLF
jgi:DNA-directed RNA polymerase I subunit RPA2